MDQTAGDLIAATVRAELARRRKSWRELGRAIGWSVGTTSRRLNGQSPINVDELVAIARFLEVPVATLIADDEHRTAVPA